MISEGRFLVHVEVGVCHQNIPVSCTSHKVVFLVLYRNMVNVAASFYNATINVTSGLSAPYSNLATIYKQQVCYYVPIIAVDLEFLLGFMDILWTLFPVEMV